MQNNTIFFTRNLASEELEFNYSPTLRLRYCRLVRLPAIFTNFSSEDCSSSSGCILSIRRVQVTHLRSGYNEVIANLREAGQRIR
ncbi:hypothetical protein LshimejAT787_1101340 [Lyophyllum shimeji]|uniref:Uncharacterized protein n=1 Tax=Lyophyllum shimeji TaxID=47721 RepID=A0A9P3PV80_LYOSH|nr:hypothetical protein LshimejAT787_1101340 [Lyophyllum shimeji]